MIEAVHRDPLTEKIIGAAIQVHRTLGPGLLESPYELALCHELHLIGLNFVRQKEILVPYKGIMLDCAFRADLIVENQVIIEIKSVEKLMSVHQAQLLTYLKLTGLRRGLLINFNVEVLKDGLKRLSM